MDTIWFYKNRRIFDNVTAQATVIVHEIRAKYENTRKALAMANVSCVRSPSASQRFIRWIPPVNGWVKLNSDGAFSSGVDIASCGGVVRDHVGSFLFASSQRLGSCSALHAELWGILTGLRLLVERGYSKVVIDTDSTACISFLS